MSKEQTPVPNNDIRHRAAGNLAFLMSVVRCGELLSEDEENAIRKIIDELDAEVSEIAALKAERDELRGAAVRALYHFEKTSTHLCGPSCRCIACSLRSALLAGEPPQAKPVEDSK